MNRGTTMIVTTARAGLWILGAAALAGLPFAACDSEESAPPAPTSSSSGSGGGQTGGGQPGGAGGSGGGFNPDPQACEGHAGQLICSHGVAVTCGPDGQPASQEDCGDEVCVPGEGCVLCIAGQHSCNGSNVLACEPGPPPAWVQTATCNPLAGETCNATKGACEVLGPIGSATPTGTYYQYAFFAELSSAFLGGCDTDSFGSYIYVNRGNWYEDGQYLDVYEVELHDSDGDGQLEPNQHPDYPDDLGPIEERTLTLVNTYNVPALGMVHHAEVFATADRVFVLGAPAVLGDLFEYDLSTGTTSTFLDSAADITIAQLGYDEVTGIWYGSSEAGRRVYSFHPATSSWVHEFDYPNLAGDHMDGLEVITDPNTGVSYVYVSDMTSDFLAQYRRDRHDGWVQENVFAYNNVTGDYVEGMGFGALNHFWITSGEALYEIGGGDLTKYTEPTVPPR